MKKFVSIVIPVYNEEAILAQSIKIITNYLSSLSHKYGWEVVLINDGSRDKSGEIADKIAKDNELIRVIHHPRNLNLGRAIQTGFKNAHGDIIVVLDLDLSYSVDHIEKLVDKQIETDADIVIASPYMKGGSVKNVPLQRALLSRWGNRVMRIISGERYHTYTCMVRAYKSGFVKSLNLKTINYEINSEIIYKGIILRARIVEVPANLDWDFQNGFGLKRKSGMNINRSFLSGLMSGFILRPYMFFLVPGSVLMLISLYIIIWIFINTFHMIPQIEIDLQFFDERFSMAIGEVFRTRPHAFIVGGITLMLSVQILSLGFISLQNKRYFEESFHISTMILKQRNKPEKEY